MSYSTELASWLYLAKLDTALAPRPGDKAPSTEQLVLPCNDEKPAIVVFLRHCGCPFAEKTFLLMRRAAEENPHIHFIAVSHSDKPSTESWLEAVGGPGSVAIVVDANRTLYARWGLGVSGWLHIFTWEVFYNLYKLASSEGIKNRPTSSGSRWQTGGYFAVNGQGIVTFGGPSARSDHIADFTPAIESLK